MNPISTFRWDPVSGRVFASDGVWTLLGIPVLPLPTLCDLFQRAYVLDRGDIRRVLDRAALEHSGFDFEWRLEVSEDVMSAVRVTAHPVHSDEGKVEFVGCMQAVIDPVSPAFLSAAALRKASEEVRQFYLTADLSPSLIWSALPNGMVDFHNRSWLEYTGISFEDSCGSGWQAAIHPDDLPRLAAKWQTLLASQQAGEERARLRRHDGVYRWFEFTATPFFTEEGVLHKWYGHNIDINDLKRAEDLLAAERTVLEMLARSDSLNATLEATCRMVDAMLPGCTSSVWLMGPDNSTVEDFVAPGLPEGFIVDLNALIAATGNGKMSLYAGPCASAIQQRKTIVIPDITTSKGWLEYCQVAIPYGFRAVVCVPMVSTAGNILGMFVLQAREAGEPSAYQQSIVEHFTHMSSMAAERKMIDEALTESEERFRLMAETSPDVIWITDLQPEHVLYCSPSFEKIWGHPVEELYRNPQLWTAVIHPEDLDHVVGTFLNGRRTSGSSQYSIEFRLLREDGSIRWIFERGVFLANDGEVPRRVSGISTDVTEKKLAEAALLETQERFELAVAASSDGIWDWDVRSGMMFMSEQAQKIYGVKVGATVRQRREWKRMYQMQADDAIEMRQRLESYMTGGTPYFSGEYRLIEKDGSVRWIRMRGLCLRDEAGNAKRVIGSVSDIDVQKRTENSLQQARRLEAMGTLAGGIAHDFNNILGVILGYGEMALRGAAVGSRLRRDLDNIMSAGERGRLLVDRILAFSRSARNERIPVHVEAVVQESIDLVSATLSPAVRISSALKAGRAAMLGDPTQIHQVVMNLITNAAQAMPDGGSIDVGLYTMTATEQRITTTGLLPPAPYLVLEVTDTGTGIAPEVLDRIFDPFFTTKEVGVGTGLGLSLVHGIVLDFGGAIDVQTVLGKGSTFSVFLPHCGTASEIRTAAVASYLRGRGQRVLLVDDEEPLVRLAEESLNELGYRPAPFTSSLSALDAFLANPEGFDAVLTDERMPGMNGSALIEEIRKLRPDMPVLLMSGYLGDLGNRTALHSVADEVLKKPFAIHDLAIGLAGIFDLSA